MKERLHGTPRIFWVKRKTLKYLEVENIWARKLGSLGWEDSLEKGKLPIPIFWPKEFHGL